MSIYKTRYTKMTAKKLIKQLMKYPENTEIEILSTTNECMEVISMRNKNRRNKNSKLSITVRSEFELHGNEVVDFF